MILVGSAIYGPAGTVLDLLTWVYVSAIIVLSGALVTSRYAAHAVCLESGSQSLKLIGRASRVSGFASWNLREWDEAWGLPAITTSLFLLLITVLVSCGSPQPPPAAELTAVPSAERTLSASAPDPPDTGPPSASSGPEASPANISRQPGPASPQPVPAIGGQPQAIVASQTLPSIADVVDRVKPAVASLTTRSVVRGFFFEVPDEGDGSGFVVRPDGYIATNYHVVQGAQEIKVHLPSGETYDGRVVGSDPVTDLAVIKIDAVDLPTATFASTDGLRVGDWVMSVGNALALKGGPTVTLGIVSALGRTIFAQDQEFYDLIQTDAAINDGDSGGPLVNLDGDVVGVNQAILRRAQGMGFAVSASVAGPVIESLIDHGRVIRPEIGFNARTLSPAIANELNLRVSEGVIVTFIPSGGPAHDAGIRLGDVIVTIDGNPTPDVATWFGLLWSHKVGDQIQVEYLHNNRIITATVTLTERPS